MDVAHGSGPLDSFASFDERIDEARRGSSEAFGELLEGCRQYLLLVANQEIDPGLAAKLGASDLVQDSFLEAQRDFRRFEGSSAEQWLAWLRQILRNNLRDAARRYSETGKRQVAREVPFSAAREPRPDTETPSRLARRVEQHESMRRALEQLPVHYREVIVLRNLRALPFRDVACRLGRSPEAARKLWNRAIHALAKELGEG